MTICTLMVELHSSALQTQEIEIGIVLVLRHTEYLPPFQVEHNFPMTQVLLKQREWKWLRNTKNTTTMLTYSLKQARRQKYIFLIMNSKKLKARVAHKHVTCASESFSQLRLGGREMSDMLDWKLLSAKIIYLVWIALLYILVWCQQLQLKCAFRNADVACILALI